MQPVLFVESITEGLVYINGRLAGETGPGGALYAPVSPGGKVYLEFRPLDREWLPMAGRLTAEGERVEVGEGLYAVKWPSGVIQVEMRPLRWRQGRENAGNLQLPEYALEPEEVRRGEGIWCVGECRDGGRYLAAFDRSGRCTMEARGEESYFTQDGDLRLFRREKDVAGHARLLTYRMKTDGLELAEWENMWAPGAPVWPDSPEKTALAAAEAVMLGLWDEAEGYVLAEAWEKCRAGLEICREYECAAPMRFPAPEGKNAVALCRQAGERWAEARPLYYHAVPEGGRQGLWRLDRIAP